MSQIGVRVLMAKSARVERGKSIFLLIDCNNFFVSCERVFQPGLRGRPVIVLSSNDGCVIARSNEAKALGIGMGVPFFKVQFLCYQKKVVVKSSNFALYGDMSRRVMMALKELWSDVEPYSIDEAFLEADDEICEVLGHSIRETLLEWVGIPVSVGIAKTKTLAKIAAKIAKKDPSYHGVYTLKHPGVDEAILRKLPVGDVWGIGWKLSRKLPLLGINTAYELSQASPHQIRSYFSVIVERVVHELNGIPCLELDDTVQDQKSRIYTRSFSKRITQLKIAEEIISTFATRLSEQLRGARQLVGGVIVIIRTGAHVEASLFHKSSDYESCGDPTSDTCVLAGAAIRALRRCFVAGVPYQKLGVILTGLQSQDGMTEGLFDRERRVKSSALMSAMDGINRVYGADMVRVAATGWRREWNTKSLHRSGAYTTDFGELLRV